jgi:hypothetical protein
MAPLVAYWLAEGTRADLAARKDCAISSLVDVCDRRFFGLTTAFAISEMINTSTRSDMRPIPTGTRALSKVVIADAGCVAPWCVALAMVVVVDRALWAVLLELRIPIRVGIARAENMAIIIRATVSSRSEKALRTCAGTGSLFKR